MLLKYLKNVTWFHARQLRKRPTCNLTFGSADQHVGGKPQKGGDLIKLFVASSLPLHGKFDYSVAHGWGVVFGDGVDP